MVQTIVNDIYAGRIVYSTPSRTTVLTDNYKPQPLRFYDVRTAPFLDHYRYVLGTFLPIAPHAKVVLSDDTDLASQRGMRFRPKRHGD